METQVQEIDPPGQSPVERLAKLDRQAVKYVEIIWPTFLQVERTMGKRAAVKGMLMGWANSH